MPQEKKIAIFGPPLAGKSTILLAFARSLGVATQVQRIRGTVEGADPQLYRTRPGDGDVQVATYAGAVWTMDDWTGLLRGCDCLLVLFDPQPARLDTDLEHLAFLRRTGFAGRGCFVVSKSDLPTSMPVRRVSQLLDLESEPFSDWPTYETTATKLHTLLAPFNYLLEEGEHAPTGE